MALLDHLRELDPQELRKGLEKFGDPTEVRDYIENMPVIVSDKKRELRVDGRFLVWWQKFVLEKPKTYITDMKELVHCYYSPYGSGDQHITVVFSNGAERTYRIAKPQDGERAFREITRYIRGFENQPAQNLEFVHEECRYSQLEISRNQIVRIREGGIFTKKITREVLAAPADRLVWCQQYTSPDAEGPDDDYLKLYTLDRKIHDIQCQNCKEAYELALKLKSLVPHLLYGPSQEYEQLFRRDPAKLLAIGKSRQPMPKNIWKKPSDL